MAPAPHGFTGGDGWAPLVVVALAPEEPAAGTALELDTGGGGVVAREEPGAEAGAPAGAAGDAAAGVLAGTGEVAGVCRAEKITIEGSFGSVRVPALGAARSRSR